MSSEATCINSGLSSGYRYIAGRTDLFNAFVCSEIESVHDGHVAEMYKNIKETILIGPDIHSTKLKSNEYLEKSDKLGSFNAEEAPIRSA